ncbi:MULTISPECIES: TetR/AcrR family transcriptional regulator [Bacillaceae]|jgi:AcrR family transcriptional regulator|uniref:TetR/AcrR family transcriptional regulator n=1 Tax=Bacillaceae TaxID=186817 RepID=UPI000D54BD44|nr:MULTISPECIES: TetR/AcrR family transcriptional regulator [Bacillaceae]AWI11230.1 TetR family transcriptional regulator [Caldibacillus thermoamylovorans]MBU5343229.1 TetR/AcrR family transcriptional regulator [Caldifermentibacillus hisashii]
MKIDGRLQRSLKTKEKLLKAAEKVFIEQGYQNTTIKEINKEANIGHGTFYIHFPEGKDEILTHLMNNVMEEFYSVADIEFTPNSKENAFEVIQEQVFHFISLAEKYKKMLMIFYEGIGVSSLLKEKWEDILNKFIDRIVKDIRYSQDQSLAKKQINPEVASRILLYSGERFLWEIVTDKNKLPISEIADNLTHVYMFGLYKGPND